MDEITQSPEQTSSPSIRNRYLRPIVGIEIMVGAPAVMGLWSYILANEVEISGNKLPLAANVVTSVAVAAGTVVAIKKSTSSC